MGGAQTLILLDTHVLVWFDQRNDRLGRRATEQANRALIGGALVVSSFTYWEIAVLSEKQRLRLAVSVELFRKRVIEAGIGEIPLDGETAIAAVRLGHFHDDPADKLIVATALSRGAMMMTADDRILEWGGPLKTFDARR